MLEFTNCWFSRPQAVLIEAFLQLTVFESKLVGEEKLTKLADVVGRDKC